MRDHTIESRYQLAKSLEQFGLLRVPVTLNRRTGKILDGDEVIKLLKAAGQTECPVWVVDIPKEMEQAAHCALQNHAGEWNWMPVSDNLKAMEKNGVATSLTCFPACKTKALTRITDWAPTAKTPVKQGEMEL